MTDSPTLKYASQWQAYPTSEPISPEPKSQKDFNEEFLVQGDDYSHLIGMTVMPWLNNRTCVDMVKGKDDRPLHCSSYKTDGEPHGTVFIVHGFTESTLKYTELIWSLVHMGYNVVAYDQRGHGLSWKDDRVNHPSVTHVDRFDDYVEDLRAVCDFYKYIMPQPWFVFSHSMGGAVAALYMESYPYTFKGAIMSAPMIAPSTGNIPFRVASALCRAARMMGKGTHYPFFMHPTHGNEIFESSCATDKARFNWYDNIKVSRPEYQNRLPSYSWIYESLHVTQRILSEKDPAMITCPVVVYSAENDDVVLSLPQKVFVNRLRRAKHIVVQGAKHEIFRSENKVLFPWWKDVLKNLEEFRAKA